MPLQKSWQNLIDYPATSSGGLLPTRSAKLLNLVPWNERIRYPRQVHTKVQSTVNSAGMEFSLEIEGEGINALLRLLGCVIISLMPEEGLEEALTSLKENFEYYVDNARYKLLPPVESWQGIGNIVSTSVRPDLIISE